MCFDAECRKLFLDIGQISLRQNLTPVNGAKCRLGGGQHVVNPVIGGIGNLVDLVGKLGELAGGFAALVLQHVRRQDELVAVGNVDSFWLPAVEVWTVS